MTDLNRRQALGAAVGVSFASITSDGFAAPNNIDFSDPQQKLDAYVRMRARGDAKKTFMRYSGTFFAKIEGEVAVPIMGIEGFSWNKCERRPDGTYHYAMQEAGYHTDLKSGQILEDWVNPLNGLKVQPKHYRSGQTSIFTPSTVTRDLENPPDGLEFNGTITRPTVIGGWVWCSEDLFVRSPNPKDRYANEREWSGPSRISTSLATHCARYSDLADPQLAFVPTTMEYTTINSWRPWMKMGQIPGIISWRLHGKKIETPDEIDDQIMKLIATEYPELLENT